MLDIMVDLETMGTVPGSVILSIGAVAFDKTELEGDTDDGVNNGGFYVVVNRASCEECFLSVSKATEAWWAKQDDDARRVLDASLDVHSSLPLATALERFNDYLGRFGERGDVRVWGNGSDFDNALLACAYDAAKIRPYWNFWNNRCYRTLKNLATHIAMEREGTYHNALDDARSQAKHLQRILEATGLALS